ncbi:MAG: hypothetical protein U1E35_06665 [Rhodospirillales bacterium]
MAVRGRASARRSRVLLGGQLIHLHHVDAGFGQGHGVSATVFA